MYIRKTKYEFFYIMCRNNDKEKEEEKNSLQFPS